MALKLSGNEIDEAVDILTAEEGSDLASLYSRVQKREQEKIAASSQSTDLMNAFFTGMAGGATSFGGAKPVREHHELDCKMTIVVRADKKSGITGGGTSAKLVSYAVIKAYERGRMFDPVSLMQWETNAWTKICLKVNSDKDIRAIA